MGSSSNCDIVKSVSDLGEYARKYRKQKDLTIDIVSALGNVSPRFLSEFERGKETAEIGKVFQALHTLGLEVVIQPRKGH